MSFLANTQSDLKSILSGDFSRRVIFYDESGGSEESRGIFDETLQTITQNGEEIVSLFPTLCIHNSLSITITQGCTVLVYPEGEDEDDLHARLFTITDFSPESSGSVLIPLRRV